MDERFRVKKKKYSGKTNIVEWKVNLKILNINGARVKHTIKYKNINFYQNELSLTPTYVVFKLWFSPAYGFVLLCVLLI